MQKMKNHAMMSSAMAQKRLAMDTNRPDFVTLTKANADAKRSIKGKEWDINLMIMVFAGSETLASSLTAIFRELVQHPGALERLTTEIRSEYAADEDITVASTTHLAYLNAVINEGLRLDPPPVITPPRLVPKGGDMVCNRFVPGGVRLPLSISNKKHPQLTNFTCTDQCCLQPILRQPSGLQLPSAEHLPTGALPALPPGQARRYG
jgi:cytochrome P450